MNKMLSESQQMRIPCDCHINGCYNQLTIKEILDYLNKCHHCWFGPCDKYGSHIGKYKCLSCICKVTGSMAMRHAQKVHTQQLPYTLEQVQKDFNKGCVIDDYSLTTAWAARFHSIFRSNETNVIKTKTGKQIRRKKLLLPKKFFPMCHVKVPAGPLSVWPSYKLNPELNILVVGGVAKDSNYTNADIPWERLMTHFLSRKDLGHSQTSAK